MSPERKPSGCVKCITGEQFARDIIKNQDLLDAINVQEMVLLAQAEERRVLGRIRLRIERGAGIDSEDYYFDARLGIVRHQREKEAGA